MNRNSFASVWDAIEDTPAEAENMKLRSALMIALTGEIKRRKWTQIEAGKAFGLMQPRISDLVRGKIDRFSLDALVNMAATAGLQVELRIAEPA